LLIVKNPYDAIDEIITKQSKVVIMSDITIRDIALDYAKYIEERWENFIYPIFFLVKKIKSYVARYERLKDKLLRIEELERLTKFLRFDIQPSPQRAECSFFSLATVEKNELKFRMNQPLDHRLICDIWSRVKYFSGNFSYGIVNGINCEPSALSLDPSALSYDPLALSNDPSVLIHDPSALNHDLSMLSHGSVKNEDPDDTTNHPSVRQRSSHLRRRGVYNGTGHHKRRHQMNATHHHIVSPYHHRKHYTNHSRFERMKGFRGSLSRIDVRNQNMSLASLVEPLTNAGIIYSSDP
jgi:hypothetical protein